MLRLADKDLSPSLSVGLFLGIDALRVGQTR